MNYQEVLSIVDKLPKYKTENHEEQEEEDENSFDENSECCICLEKDKLWKTECNHIICKKCIPQMQNHLCPICRREFNYSFDNIKKIFIPLIPGGFIFNEPNYFNYNEDHYNYSFYRNR